MVVCCVIQSELAGNKKIGLNWVLHWSVDEFQGIIVWVIPSNQENVKNILRSEQWEIVQSQLPENNDTRVGYT